MMATEPKTFGVYRKIATVMNEVGAVNKDSRHGQGFMYQSIEAVTSALRGIMANNGLILLSEVIASHDTGSQWVCEYRFTFIDIEDGSNIPLSWQQAIPHKDGKDDKAMGKNHTYAQKYFLLRTFLVTSKDDVDADTNDFEGNQAFTPSVVKKNNKSTKNNNNQGKKQSPTNSTQHAANRRVAVFNALNNHFDNMNHLMQWAGEHDVNWEYKSDDIIEYIKNELGVS